MEEYKIGIADALFSLRNGAEWTVHSDDTIEWLSNDFVQPTDAEIQAEITRLQTEYDNNKYQRDRKRKYPDIGDQLDALYHAGAFPEDMASKLKAVKDEFPKE